MSFLDRILKQDLVKLDLHTTGMSADFESDAPTGVSLSDIKGMEQFLLGVKTHSGQIVTPEKARRCSAVLACMRGISEDLSSLPCVLYKRGPNGDERAEDHVVNDLIDSTPNDLMTPVEMREHIIFDLMLHGNFYVLKNEDPEAPGQIESLWPLQAGYVTRRWREAVWSFTDPLTGISSTFTPDTVWRGTILSANGMDGVAITLLGREAIGLLLAAEEQGARLFSQGVQSDLVVTSTPDTEVDDNTKKELRESFMRRYSGSQNSFLPILATGGLDVKRIGLTAQESQYLDARAFQVQDVARIFRYPEVLLGSSGKGSKASTYASAEQFFQSYTKHTLTPWAVRIEQTMHRDLLTTKERKKYYVKHDFSSLLRADTAARYASYATGIDKGFITPGYAAKQEQLPWKPELEYYNKPAPPAPGANQQEDKSAPTDQSAKGLPRRVAEIIWRRELKAIVGKKQDADVFYAHFGGFLEDITGAGVDDVTTYLEMRRTTADRFSVEAHEKAISNLIVMCKKDK